MFGRGYIPFGRGGGITGVSWRHIWHESRLRLLLVFLSVPRQASSLGRLGTVAVPLLCINAARPVGGGASGFI